VQDDERHGVVVNTRRPTRLKELSNFIFYFLETALFLLEPLIELGGDFFLANKRKTISF